MASAAPSQVRLHLPRPHGVQQRIKNERARFNVLALGRRTGKTTLGIDLELEGALPGYPVAWFAPNYKLLADVWRDAVRLLAPLTERRDTQQHRLELSTGGVLEFWSLDGPDPARGRKYKRVVIDEAAMVPHLQEAWQLAIRPTLTDYRGDAYFLSTPKGLNYFHALYQLGQDPSQTDWKSWQFPTASNPFIDPDEVEAARLELPERAFAQEYLAEFLADGAGVFRRVAEAAVLEPGTPEKGHWYVFGVDWGKLNDFTVLSVIDGCCRKQVALDRFQQIDYTLQVGRLEAASRTWSPRVIIAESNSMGVPLIEQLQRLDLPVQPFQTTNATKAVAIEALSIAFERSDLQLLRDPVQTAELLAYDAERLPSGLLRYGAPPGLHDDTVMALALAYQAIAEARANREVADMLRGGLPMSVKSGEPAANTTSTMSTDTWMQRSAPAVKAEPPKLVRFE